MMNSQVCVSIVQYLIVNTSDDKYSARTHDDNNYRSDDDDDGDIGTETEQTETEAADDDGDDGLTGKLPD